MDQKQAKNMDQKQAKRSGEEVPDGFGKMDHLNVCLAVAKYTYLLIVSYIYFYNLT